MENESLLNQMKRHIKRQKGVTVVEYALMIALVAIVERLSCLISAEIQVAPWSQQLSRDGSADGPHAPYSDRKEEGFTVHLLTLPV